MPRILTGLALLTVALLAVPASAEFIDLSSWTELTLDLPGGQSAGNWVLSAGNTTVTQTINADPSFYLNNSDQTSYTMNGTWRVVTGGDDDLIGFAFGYQDPGHCYIMDWKQTAQNISPYGFRDEGFCIRKMHGDPGTMTLNDYWAHGAGDTEYSILATSFGSTLGWQDNVLYSFTLVFTPGEFTVTVKQDATVLWEATVVDATYPAGQFAFYNFSQSNVEYSGFTQNLYPTCDAGGPYDAEVDQVVTFNGSGSDDPDGSVATWHWDFGDGTTGDGEMATHAYVVAGAYVVTLCVTDDLGLQSCCETVADITEPVPTAPTTWGTVKSQFHASGR
jgi:hypothetical protein